MVTVTVYGDLTTCKLLASMLARRPLVHCSTAFEDCARVFFAHKGLNLFDAKNFFIKKYNCLSSQVHRNGNKNTI